MTHKSSHVIISGLNNTVSYGENGRAFKVWQVALALLVLGAVIGAWIS